MGCPIITPTEVDTFQGGGTIEGVRGKVKRKLKITPVVHPKTAMAPHAWWLPETEGGAPNFYGIWDLNVNKLIPMGCESKAGYGGAPIKTMLCKIYAMGPEESIPTENTKMDRLDFTDTYNEVK